MKKKTKIKILEFLILITIIISVLAIANLAYQYIDNRINDSTSNKNENYSANKITTYSLNIEEVKNYKIPYYELINISESSYKRHIKSTDNYINGLEEEITIKYSPLEEGYNLNTIINFCNKFNEIENDYKFTCELENLTLHIKNEFKIPISSIRESKKNIKIDIEENEKLSAYLKKLDDQNINYHTETEKQKKHQ